ncbi:MAG: hypothetical protein A3E37_00410 [Candidatus Andersenbacteria bacterium RIFCSPHIGHO2_12_FULL_46_9]|nr:MAG: hypothetical protein UW94_C0004G0029 [Parcubacteria group bacterium GW2011_GWA2_45_14]OGY34775.1 MAG: hypothetical protein A3B76_00210 [Candidatus Andersenbacteria bacterium RIFCSPHIGHO2_02_FULL_46_16]OGY35913.1 MAG: hypothetical protein A3E37_00410 [Candidatus Andersenbacteria bacterium RIFCSPHIGHO2_12_FULL_46_9]OGY38130.1 MAG: hypothetical protein A3I08_04000 [Candidatus Andersenbacteria bacterium RIFCSPLOWO2_02_FULL_46_11]OGY39438.1 MAG: hypothetical protein A3G57_00555 [Candidatus A
MIGNTDEYINILIALEPVIKRAGKLALQLRPNVQTHYKHKTGIRGIDIVTDADLAVQEAILQEMAKTKLVECQLIAEEDTPSVAKFKGTNGLTLTLDPIDGTIWYVSNADFFSTIVCLRDTESLLYTFCHYPVVDWSRRITDNIVEDFGALPHVKTSAGLDFTSTIAHTFGNPQETAPDIYQTLTNEGYVFRSVKEITDESGSCTLFFLNQVAGYYTENPSAYDGLPALHYGQAKQLQIYSTLDITKIMDGTHGPYHPGWYVVLRK